MPGSASDQRAAEFLDIAPIARMSGTVRLPGSKSISNRSLLLAALARGTTKLTGLLDADDVDRMRESLRTLGVQIEDDVAGDRYFRMLGGRLWFALPILRRGRRLDLDRIRFASPIGDRPVGIDVDLAQRPAEHLGDGGLHRLASGGLRHGLRLEGSDGLDGLRRFHRLDLLGRRRHRRVDRFRCRA